MSLSTDITDGWEREGVDPRYFSEFSRNSHAVGSDILLYAMTHYRRVITTSASNSPQ